VIDEELKRIETSGLCEFLFVSAGNAHKLQDRASPPHWQASGDPTTTAQHNPVMYTPAFDTRHRNPICFELSSADCMTLNLAQKYKWTSLRLSACSPESLLASESPGLELTASPLTCLRQGWNNRIRSCIGFRRNGCDHKLEEGYIYEVVG
jgi:hypothetical protein